MRLGLISYLIYAFLPLNISAVDRNTCDCSFFSVKSRLCNEDQTCCTNKYNEKGCCPYKNGICCLGGQCCPAGMECNLDKMRCDFTNVNETTYPNVCDGLIRCYISLTSLNNQFSEIWILNIYNEILFTCLINSRARHSAIYLYIEITQPFPILSKSQRTLKMCSQNH